MKARRALRIRGASARETLSMNTGVLSASSTSAITMGTPSLARERPLGVVVVFCLSSVVGAICPPVIP